MKNYRKGSTSMIALIMLLVLVTASLGVSAFVIQSLGRTRKDRTALTAFQGSQAGLDLAIARAYNALAANNGVFVNTTTTINEELAAIASGATGTTTVVPQTDNTYAWVTSTVSFGGRTKSVRSMIRSRNVGIWNNAIFAGTGASGQAINGNVDIRGSVHILGDGEPYSDLNGNGKWDKAETFTDSNNNGTWDPGEPFVDANSDGVWNAAEPYNDTNNNGIYDPPLTQTDLNSSFSGTAYIGNNYSGMDAGLEAVVPAAPRVNGIETLSTEVRVKHGRIGINGNASIGTDDSVDGGTSKATIDGSYVSDGYTGNQGANSVFSDNGTSNSYDLGHVGIDFPLLSGIGADPYIDKTGTTWTNHETFLDAKSLTVNLSTITATTAAFSFSDGNGNSIAFTPQVTQGNNVTKPAKLTVNGIVRINGSIQIGGSKQLITYDGNGTVFAKQDISISCSLLPANGKTFPTTARLGLIAKRNMNLATGSGDAQLKLAGAFYAQGRITSAKQNEIMGTFVANFYDMGTNVPKIYQVPALPYNMPPAMPGDKMYFTLKVQSWRERQ
ncbi:MAG TPA: hypothetical protein PLH94_08545 [Fimbriimonadaceae bacterium]|nr:hypothetical protein [Fimbriimonadaceae bacterium]